MPYTPAHAIISLPISALSRGKIPLASLIIGSMSPDLPYLLALKTTYAPGHSLLGVLIYCLLPSIFVVFLWYHWLEKPILELFRLPHTPLTFDKTTCFSIVIGILVGAYSHVIWDASSHYNGVFVVDSHFWNKEIFSLPVYQLNQYGSGILGSIALVIWYGRALTKNTHNAYHGHLILGLSIFMLSIICFMVLANLIHHSDSTLDFLVRSSIGLISGSIIAACLYAFVVKQCKSQTALSAEYQTRNKTMKTQTKKGH